MDISVFVGPLIAGLITFAGSYLAFSQRVVVLETKLDELSRRVEKHNNVVERTFVLERDVKTAFHQIDQINGELRSK